MGFVSGLQFITKRLGLLTAFMQGRERDGLAVLAVTLALAITLTVTLSLVGAIAFSRLNLLVGRLLGGFFLLLCGLPRCDGKLAIVRRMIGGLHFGHLGDFLGSHAVLIGDVYFVLVHVSSGLTKLECGPAPEA
jgi:hypothetical protein